MSIVLWVYVVARASLFLSKDGGAISMISSAANIEHSTFESNKALQTVSLLGFLVAVRKLFSFLVSIMYHGGLRVDEHRLTLRRMSTLLWVYVVACALFS